MKRKIILPVLPVLTLLLGLFLAGAMPTGAVSNATSPSAPLAGGNATACYSTAAPASSSLTLGKRPIAPNSLLQVSNGSTCPAGETALGLANYQRTVLASPKDTPLNSGTALLAALASIQNATPAPSASSPYLLKLEPGIYDLGSQSFNMLQFVDLEGSGEDTTTITSAVTTSSSSPTTGTITGANNSEIRFLKVVNSGTGNQNAAIYLSGKDKTARITHLTAMASGTGANVNYGLYNSSSSPTIQNSNMTGSGGNSNAGLYNSSSSSPTVQNSFITASGGSSNNYGFYNFSSSSPNIQNSSITASGGTNSYGLYNNFNSSPNIQNSSINSSGGNSNFGLYNSSSSPTMQNSSITASGGIENYGLFNTAAASASSPIMQNSVLKGTTNSIYNTGNTGTTRIAASQLDGPVAAGGTMVCVGVYNGSFTSLSATCT